MSLRTSSWLLPQNEQTRLPERSSCFAINASHASLGGPSVNDYLIDQAVFKRLLGSQENVPVRIIVQFPQALPGMLHQDTVKFLSHSQNLFGVNLQIRCLAAGTTQR